MIDKIYLILNLLTFGSTFLLSYHKRLRFDRYFKKIFISIGVVGIFFVVWDHVFTIMKVWGFNYIYLVGLKIFSLPLEEVMFFVSVPFAILYIYLLVDKFSIQNKLDKHVYIVTAMILYTISISLALSLKYIGGVYSMVVGVLLISVLKFSMKNFEESKKNFMTYFITLIPFLIFNGILVNGFPGLETPVVWYNPESILGLRIIGIPLEDFLYQFCLTFMLIEVYRRV